MLKKFWEYEKIVLKFLLCDWMVMSGNLLLFVSVDVVVGDGDGDGDDSGSEFSSLFSSEFVEKDLV